MTLVIDAGLVIAALVDGGPVGTWADQQLVSDDLAAPHLMPVEAADILRRASLSGEISTDTASLAYADLLGIRVELFDYEPFATRIWDLRANVTAYDGWYVAVAESLDAPLGTLDLRLSRASGTRCEFATPPDPGHR
jgi:predicted nucleic acid-binding protein